MISSWYRHDIDMISSWYRHDIVMISTWYRHDIDMISSWYRHDIVMISTWYRRDRSIFSFIHVHCRQCTPAYKTTIHINVHWWAIENSDESKIGNRIFMKLCKACISFLVGPVSNSCICACAAICRYMLTGSHWQNYDQYNHYVQCSVVVTAYDF